VFSEIPANTILELFGKMFFEFCQDSGYDKILQVLGATPRDFLQVSVNMRLQRQQITLEYNEPSRVHFAKFPHPN
jgi:hypothetical protein